MTLGRDDWRPSPELLAAYADGELDRRPVDAALRRRVEEWLADHPEAQAALADHLDLVQLCHEAPPPDPGAAAWRRLEKSVRLGPPARRRVALQGWAAVLGATAAAAALTWWVAFDRTPAPASNVEPVMPRAEAVEVFPVATAAEVTILRVEGDDTQTLVVGEPPVQGPLELAGPGEVALTSVQPDARDNMLPQVRLAGPHRPMIWAHVDAEDGEP